MGSETGVKVDGKQLNKNEEVPLSVGSEISFGSDTVYKVCTTAAGCQFLVCMPLGA